MNNFQPFQIYKQGRGAIDHDGGAMEPGWYYVAMRDSLVVCGGCPYGANHGPFQTKRDVMRAVALEIIRLQAIEIRKAVQS